MKKQKDTISLWAFIVKRVFILSSIASETGYFLEIVQLMQRRQSLKYSVIGNKIQGKKTLIISAIYFTHERSCKKKHFVHKHSLWRECLF